MVEEGEEEAEVAEAVAAMAGEGIRISDLVWLVRWVNSRRLLAYRSWRKPLEVAGEEEAMEGEGEEAEEGEVVVIRILTESRESSMGAAVLRQ